MKHGNWETYPKHSVYYDNGSMTPLKVLPKLASEFGSYSALNQFVSEYERIFEYIRIFEYFPPNIDIRIRFVVILNAEYYSNIRIF